jgi:hypothetical protein
MPRDGAYMAAVLGDKARWSDTDYLLALAVDALHVANWQRARAHFKGKPKAPEALPRPGVPTPGRRRFGSMRLTPTALRARLGMDKEVPGGR